MKDEIYENAQDLVYTLCPIQNRDQPNWEQGARNLIFGLVLAFCEDCIKGKMDEKAVALIQCIPQYHEILFGGYDGAERIFIERARRIFKSARTRKYGADNKR